MSARSGVASQVTNSPSISSSDASHSDTVASVSGFLHTPALYRAHVRQGYSVLEC